MIPKAVFQNLPSEIKQGFQSAGESPLESISLAPSPERNLRNQVILLQSWSLSGTSAATATNYGTMFVADKGYKLVGASEKHTAAADAGSTLQIEKCSSGQAPDAGTVLLATAFDLNLSANVPRFATLVRTKTDLILKRGDSLVAKDASLAGSPTDIFVQLYLAAI